MRIGATGVVLHPGSAKGGHVDNAIERAGRRDRRGARRVRSLRAASGGHRGRRRHARSFLRRAGNLIDAAGGDARLGLCLDSCHLLRLRLRHPDGRRARRDARGVRADGRARAAALAAPERLDDATGFQSGPARAAGQGRARRQRSSRCSCRTIASTSFHASSRPALTTVGSRRRRRPGEAAAPARTK